MKARAEHQDWPQPLGEEAFHGLAGDVVRTIEPHTEADPAALLLHFLVAFGNIVGRGPHFEAESHRHGFNLFAVMVGRTSKGRKGTAWSRAKRLVAGADPGWAEHCIQTGLSSGEGLIHAVRDPSGISVDGDPGIADKRLMVVETEFASTLRVMARSGNTLSPVLRLAWDGSPLQVMAKQSPDRATGAHISTIAHITMDELLRELTGTDAASGFANRFLWACVDRSKVLPDGSQIPEADLQPLENRVRGAVEYAHSLGDHEFCRDAEARAIWHSVYAGLSEGKPGLSGAVTSRAETQVIRLACIYALLDNSPVIGQAHLRAALAVWGFCEASVWFIFGDALGDPVADEILRLLRVPASKGLTRTELSHAFGRNRQAVEIDRGLACLERYGLARSKTEETGGRPAVRWYAVTRKQTGKL